METASLLPCPLFRGIAAEELPALLKCLNGYEKSYQRQEILLHAGELCERFGILVSGTVQILKEDHHGNATLVAQVLPGELFAEAFVCGAMPLSVTVMAAADSMVLWLDYRRFLSPCQKACVFHRQLTANLLKILATRNRFLTGRLEHLSQRSLREKVLSFLEEQVQIQGSSSVQLPFDRQGMADYLAADRSALSAVLSRMQKDGVIQYHKNHFTLL